MKKKSTNIPTPHSITSDWLTQALSSSKIFENTQIASFRMQPIGVKQGFTGSLFRLELSYVESNNDVPKSIVVKFSPTEFDYREAIKDFNMREVNFYELATTESQLPLVDCYYSEFDADTSSSILLIEDLSNVQTIEFLDGCNIEDAKIVVQALAQLHVRWWNSPQLEKISWLSSFHTWDFVDWWQQYPHELHTLLPNLDIPDSIFKVGGKVMSNLPSIINRLEGSPTTLIHRDIHVDNILFEEQSIYRSARIIDWQLVGRGLGISDIAYFMISSIPPKQRQQAEHDLVKMYHSNLEQAGIDDYSFKQCWADYKFSAVAKLLITVAATLRADNTSEHRRAWRKADLERLVDFIEYHKVYELF